MTTSVAVIGAGIAGLTVARALTPFADVTVFEKSRGPGGRVATRYADPWRFDHGAQFFTVRDERFREMLAPLLTAGQLAIWEARFAEFSGTTITARRQWDTEYPHYVGVPGMNALGQALAKDLDVRLGTRVEQVGYSGDGWQLAGADDLLGTYDWLVMTAPCEQAKALLPKLLGDTLPDAPMRGCYSLMLGFEAPLELDFDAALVREADISWISVNSSKPGRAAAPTLLVHATNRWADAHIEDAQADVETHLLAETERVIGRELAPAHRALHRWRYANIDRQSGPTHALLPAQRLGVCGDWFVRGRIEAAAVSGVDMAAALHSAHLA